MNESGIVNSKQIDFLLKRLEESEKRIEQLTCRVAKLESELNRSSTVHYETASNTSSELSDKIFDDVIGGKDLKFTLEKMNTIVPPPPPPPPPSIENFKFTSTPNPVFLSYGKVHQKKGKQSSDGNSTETNQKDSFTKRKRQRYKYQSKSLLSKQTKLKQPKKYQIKNKVLLVWVMNCLQQHYLRNR